MNPLRRVVEITIALFALALLAPIFVILAAAVKLSSPGPVFYRGLRTGRFGKPFRIFKFRSMVVDGERLGGTTTSLDDRRVTRVGGWLRRHKLDELPQLLNVLRGEMSLVGPRPELPWLVDKYQPWQRRRFDVPQGMTGWWQINGRSEKLMHLHTEEDLYYIQNYSLWLDIRILLGTLRVVLSRRGAY